MQGNILRTPAVWSYDWLRQAAVGWTNGVHKIRMSLCFKTHCVTESGLFHTQHSSNTTLISAKRWTFTKRIKRVILQSVKLIPGSVTSYYFWSDGGTGEQSRLRPLPSRYMDDMEYGTVATSGQGSHSISKMKSPDFPRLRLALFPEPPHVQSTSFM